MGSAAGQAAQWAIDWEIIGKGSIAFALVIAALWLYNRREQRRKRAMKFADVLKEWHLNWFADAYEMYAVGDYSGLAYKVKEAFDTVNSGEQMLLRFDKCFFKILDYYALKPDKREAIQKVMDATKPPATTGAGTAVATAPAATVAVTK